MCKAQIVHKGLNIKILHNGGGAHKGSHLFNDISKVFYNLSITTVEDT